MKKIIFVLLFISSSYLFSQPYLKAKTRQRFAQTVLGVELQTFSGGSSSFIDPAGKIEHFNFNGGAAPRIYIGGTHFWGHAEFYFAISLFTFGHLKYSDLNYNYSQSDIFGTKIFPWAIQKKKLRPFVGFSLAPVNYRQYTDKNEGLGPQAVALKIPLLFGFNYCTGNYLLEAGINYNHNNQLNYYIGKTTQVSIHTPPLMCCISVKKWLETTTSSEKDYLDGTTEKHFQSLKKAKKLDSWFWALGLSAAFYTSDSPYNQSHFSFMRKPISSTYPEASLGYFYQALGLHVALAARHNSATLKSYGLSETFRRTALTLESYAYLFDYNGFDPYLGVCLSQDWLSFAQSGGNTADVTVRRQQVSPGFLFGWDILPDKLQGLTLRTSVRYFPYLWLQPAGDKKISLNQLEVNLIQLVVYPQRLRNFRREYAQH